MKNRVEQILQVVQTSSQEEIVFNEELILEEYNQKKEETTSLAIKIMSIVGGFFGTTSFLGFLFLAGIYDSEIAMVISGIVFIVASIFLNQKSERIITDTVSITLYIVGLSLFLLGMNSAGEVNMALLAILISLGTLFLTQHYTLSFIATLIVSASLFFLLFTLNNSFYLIYVYNTFVVLAMSFVFLFESNIISKHKKISKLYNPVRAGLVISFLFGLGVLRTRVLFDTELDFIWFYAVVLFVIVIFITTKTLNKLEVTEPKINYFSYGIITTILFTTVFSPSILGALLLILLSFYVNFKTGFVLGLFSLTYFVFQYYYDLNLTLLTKSIILFCSGVLFLALYFLISKNKNNAEI